MLSVSPSSSDLQDDTDAYLFVDQDWNAINQEAVADTANESIAVWEANLSSSTSHEGPGEELLDPVIPFDESVDPFSDCSDLPPEFCFPGDASHNDSFDFEDFLLLQQNYGMENASWQDGDFSGDGRVGFEDLLILSSNYGGGEA